MCSYTVTMLFLRVGTRSHTSEGLARQHTWELVDFLSIMLCHKINDTSNDTSNECGAVVR